MKRSPRLYVLLLLAGFGATLLPILVLNLLLGKQTLGHADKVLRASQWQQATHGVTYAPTLTDTGPFKAMRLLDRLPEINTVVLGSSTALGITAGAFPHPMAAYNFAQTGHGLISDISEAEWLMSNGDNVKYLVIPLDWSIGFLYQEGEPAPADLSASSIKRQAAAHAESIPLFDRLRDALSYPRIASLFEIMKQIARAENSRAAFRQYFLQDSSDDYHCADGTLGKDFDTMHRGTCTGFRFDGSATFANSEPVHNAESLILSATTSSSQYVVNLLGHRGEPNPILLRHLATLSHQIEHKGGKLLLFMPPLLPGMESSFLQQPQLSAVLAHTKDILRTWARQQNIVILDAGQSEHYGCNAEEFIDEHHALPSCYNKIFSAFWSRQTHINGNNITWPAGGLY